MFESIFLRNTQRARIEMWNPEKEPSVHLGISPQGNSLPDRPIEHYPAERHP